MVARQHRLHAVAQEVVLSAAAKGSSGAATVLGVDATMCGGAMVCGNDGRWQTVTMEVLQRLCV